MLKNRRNNGDEKRHGSVLDLQGTPSKFVHGNYTRIKKYYDTEKNDWTDQFNISSQNQKKGKSIRSFGWFVIVTFIVMKMYFQLHKIEISYQSTNHYSKQYQTKLNVIKQDEKSNHFDMLFEKALGDTSERKYLGFYIENNIVYCNQDKMKRLDKSTSRHRTFVDMLTKTLQQYPLNLTRSRYHDSFGVGDGVPIFLIHDDLNGCETYGNHDLGLPHFAWSEPLYNETCLAIAIPGYHNWRKYAKVKVEPKHWITTFLKQNKWYRWKHKLSKAVWRGSSTGHAVKFADGSANFTSLPRTQLVLKAQKRPDLFNVGYSKFVGRFSGQEKALSNITTIQTKMIFDDFMKFV